MSNRQSVILNKLQSGSGSASAADLALWLNAPVASIRRDIQTLRRLGHNINDARDNDGLYRLAV